MCVDTCDVVRHRVEMLMKMSKASSLLYLSCVLLVSDFRPEVKTRLEVGTPGGVYKGTIQYILV